VLGLAESSGVSENKNTPVVGVFSCFVFVLGFKCARVCHIALDELPCTFELLLADGFRVKGGWHISLADSLRF
jgi:hypothetical protein